MRTKLGRSWSGGLLWVLVSGLLTSVASPADACHNYVSERTGAVGCAAKRADLAAAQANRLQETVSTSTTSRSGTRDSGAGVSWNSGLSCFYGRGITLSEFGNWRGTPVKAVHGWSGKTLEKAVQYFSSNSYRAFTQSNMPVISISTPLLPTGGTLEKCAAGAYDSFFRTIGEQTAARGRPDTILRLGWELNLRWPAWSAVGRPETYKACFQQAVRVIRGANPRAQIEWSLGRQNYMSDWREAYPGDSYVDIIGLSFYDRYPPYRTQADWDTMANNPPSARITGIETVIAFARERRKKVGVGEWAVSDGKGNGFDNPLFIENMYQTFSRHRDVIAYETYYNCGDDGMYKVYPPYHNPLAAERYRSLW